MQIGAHISKSGSLESWVDNAIERECSAFQVFTRSPRSWFAKDLDLEEAEKYKQKLEASDIDRMATCAHMPYLPNLSTPEDEGYEKSIKSMICAESIICLSLISSFSNIPLLIILISLFFFCIIEIKLSSSLQVSRETFKLVILE